MSATLGSGNTPPTVPTGTAAVPSTAREDRRRRVKAIVGVGTGNAIEYFDWTVYAIFAAFFAGQFFHTGSAVSDLLAGFAVFAVGFVARPFGGSSQLRVWDATWFSARR